MSPAGQHHLYRYSVRIATSDLGVLHCLRALSQHAHATGNKRIPWGGTKESDWRAAGQIVVFHFSKPEYRDDFLVECKRLLSDGLWFEEEIKDNDQAHPQS